eukprot:3873632-Prorocentrum_lima.AAC.1
MAPALAFPKHPKHEGLATCPPAGSDIGCPAKVPTPSYVHSFHLLPSIQLLSSNAKSAPVPAVC